MRQSSNKNRLIVIMQYIILGILGTVAFYFSKPQFLFFFIIFFIIGLILLIQNYHQKKKKKNKPYVL